MVKILIVDDSKTINAQVSQVLEDIGYKVIIALDGIEGLAALESNDDVALIISDLNMPKMDGIEMIRQIKAGAHAQIPIIIHSTEGSKSFMTQARDAGVNAWISKPFKQDHLIALVKKLL